MKFIIYVLWKLLSECDIPIYYIKNKFTLVPKIMVGHVACLNVIYPSMLLACAISYCDLYSILIYTLCLDMCCLCERKHLVFCNAWTQGSHSLNISPFNRVRTVLQNILSFSSSDILIGSTRECLQFQFILYVKDSRYALFQWIPLNDLCSMAVPQWILLNDCTHVLLSLISIGSSIIFWC